MEVEGGEEGKLKKILGGLASKAVDHGQPLLNNLGTCASWFGELASSVCSISVLQIAGLERSYIAAFPNFFHGAS